MTIYSRHANRGKTQLLAIYQGVDGVESPTVTSLSDPRLALPIVDALNRISALATVPVSMHDRREQRGDYYPRKHLAALTGAAARADLLRGTHSLWYEYGLLQPHQALSDLDDALVSIPDTVRRAIHAEPELEECELRAARITDERWGTTTLCRTGPRDRWAVSATGPVKA